MEAYDLDQLITFSREFHTKHVFFESKNLKAQVMGLEPGRRIPPCSMDHDVVFLVIDGEGEVIVYGQSVSVRPTSWVHVPKEIQTRSIEARTKMAILATQLR